MAETSVFESARVTHEEIEQYEKLLADTLNNPPRSGAHRLHLEWQLASSELCLLYTSPSPRDRG